jgi:ABC-type oligopeptide transport system ATPase subunit
MHLVQRVFQYFQPLPFHLDLEQRLSRIIRQSYVGRNPFSPDYARSFHQGWYNIERGFSPQHIQNATAFGMSVVGISGMGKTTAVDRILRLIPQTIVHSNYKGKDLNMLQVPWLNLQTPFDGSLKSLSLDFMAKVDRLIGTTYFEKYGKKSRLSTNVLLPLMGQIARSISLGVLIIDEIQHLTAARNGAEKTLNYFVTLVNELGIPIVLISTPKGMGVLQSEFRQARRSSGQGYILLDRLKKDEVWELFIRGLWQYQWTREVVRLDAEISTTLFEVSQGIIDIACKAFALAQLRAISTGQERLTPSLIRKVAAEQFKLLKPMLDALKEGKISKLAAYEDIVIPDIAQFATREKTNHDLSILMKKETFTRNQTLSQLKEEAIFRLKFLGVAEKESDRVVEKVLSDYPTTTDVNFIVQEVYKSLISIKGTLEKTIQGDLRNIVQSGKEAGLEAYEAMRLAGYIKA